MWNVGRGKVRSVEFRKHFAFLLYRDESSQCAIAFAASWIYAILYVNINQERQRLRDYSLFSLHYSLRIERGNVRSAEFRKHFAFLLYRYRDESSQYAIAFAASWIYAILYVNINQERQRLRDYSLFSLHYSLRIFVPAFIENAR